MAACAILERTPALFRLHVRALFFPFFLLFLFAGRLCHGRRRAVSSGIQGWSVRIARGLNGHLGRKGTVFDDRYHVEVLATPTQIRHALCYVLQNARRHGEPLDPRFGGIDPFSSAWWFDGWRDDSWKLGIPPPEVRTVAAAESWLLRVGWKRSKYGLISISEVPPAARR